MMQLTLSSCGNPDFQHDPERALSPTVQIEVATFQDASAACDAYIAQYNLGGGNWSGGQLCEQGQPVGRVSYNGRVWGVDEQCVYDPFGA